MKRLFLILVLIVWLVPSAVGATDYYITQAQQGGGGGLSYANSDSAATFNTGAAPYDDLDSDTVYLCDTITTMITVPDGGTSGNEVTIRGDYAGHAGIIDGSTELVGETWVDLGSNLWSYAHGYSNYVVLDGSISKYVAVPAAQGDWFYDNPDIKIYSTSDPSIAFSSILVGSITKEYGIKIDSLDYVIVRNLTFYGIESRSNVYVNTDGGVLLKDADYCEVRDSTFQVCARSIVVADNSDYATVDGNTIQMPYKYDSASPDNKYSVGISSVGNDATISNNEIDGEVIYYQGTTVYGAKGIMCEIRDYPDYYSKNVKIYGNEIYNVCWFGINIQQEITGTAIRVINAEIYENYLYGSQDMGLGEEDGIALGCNAGDEDNRFTNVKIHSNFVNGFYNTSIITANFWDEIYIYNNLLLDSPYGVYAKNTNYIYNNSIYNISHDGIVKYAKHITGAAGDGTLIRNNVIQTVSDAGGHGYAVYVEVESEASGSHNCVYDIDAVPDFFNFTNTSGVAADPLFVDAANDIFTLKSSSPCINTGVLIAGFQNALSPSSSWPDDVTLETMTDGIEIGAYNFLFTSGIIYNANAGGVEYNANAASVN